MGIKGVFVGGGALRHLATLRGAMGDGAFDGGHIVLFDLDRARAEAIGRMLLKTPEHKRCACKVSWDLGLDEALEGADVVSVVLLGGSRLTYELGHAVSLQHGYISSDNLSPNGAILAAKTAPILMDLARRMQRRCPDALLLDFANPVAVMSALVNNHFGIQTLGVCAGYTNHQWDLSRIFGKDALATDLDVDVAGVNHLSYILGGRWGRQEILAAVGERIARGWRLPVLGKRWSPRMRGYIRRGVGDLARHFRELGVLVFSTEGDGMAHLDYEQAVARARRDHPPTTRREVEAKVRRDAIRRQTEDERFRSVLEKDTDDRFWAQRAESDAIFGRAPDIFTRILSAVAKRTPTKIVASRPNGGAVTGFSDRTVLEYSQTVSGKRIQATGRLAVPAVVQGITAGLAAHQTMLADALAADDPREFARALMAYPIRPYSRDLRALCKALIRLNGTEVPLGLRRAFEFL